MYIYIYIYIYILCELSASTVAWYAGEEKLCPRLPISEGKQRHKKWETRSKSKSNTGPCL